jgi:hypothetical protein
MFARIENNIVVEYPVAEHDIRERFPMTSFTTDFSSGLPDGYVDVRPSSPPPEDTLKVYSEGTPVVAEGFWTQTWVGTDRYTAEELTKIDAQKERDKWDALRSERDGKISDSSWIIERHRDQRDSASALSITESEFQAWLAYRQSLRDFPAAVADIDSVVWPVPPNELEITVL